MRLGRNTRAPAHYFAIKGTTESMNGVRVPDMPDFHRCSGAVHLWGLEMTQAGFDLCDVTVKRKGMQALLREKRAALLPLWPGACLIMSRPARCIAVLQNCSENFLILRRWQRLRHTL